MHIHLGNLVVMCRNRKSCTGYLSVYVLPFHNFCFVTDSRKSVKWVENLQRRLLQLPQNSQPSLHFWLTSLHIQQPSREVTCTGGASVQCADTGNASFSNHTTSARITPSRIRVLVLSVGGSVLISLICLNSRETGYGYRDRSHYSIAVAGLQKRRLDETSFINAGSKFQSL
jgi:hypothetical protein